MPDDPVEAARLLLGWTIVSRIGGEEAAVRLTEVEAYGGSDDPASHAWRGRTARNAAMFLGQGHLYVYLSYGIHHLANVVVGPPGQPGAVLLRSGVPVSGEEVMLRRRGGSRRLADGPGNLGAALGLTLRHDGVRLGSGEIDIEPGEPLGPVLSSPRVGISRAKERPWRFFTGA